MNAKIRKQKFNSQTKVHYSKMQKSVVKQIVNEISSNK